jgi:hypothetical protein
MAAAASLGRATAMHPAIIASTQVRSLRVARPRLVGEKRQAQTWMHAT